MDPRARRLLFNVLPLVASIAIVYLAVFGPSGLLRRFRMREELTRVEFQLRQVEADNAVLARRISMLRDDPVTQDRAAAEELLLVPANSRVYRLAP